MKRKFNSIVYSFNLYSLLNIISSILIVTLSSRYNESYCTPITFYTITYIELTVRIRFKSSDLLVLLLREDKRVVVEE